MNQQNTSYHYLNATGKIDYTLLNDYMFRAIMQKHEDVLKGLTCATLQLESGDIKSIHIENPIELGKAIDNKEFVMDIKVLLNNDTLINFELQVINYSDWPDRSLSYLCRNYDHLHHGEEYNDSMSAIHVGILDFNLFPDYPEFFAQYQLLNIKNHHVYNDKFQLRVLELNHINLATEEDKKYGLDKWAALFNRNLGGVEAVGKDMSGNGKSYRTVI